MEILTLEQILEATGNKKTKPAQGWRTVAGAKIYFRSKWEANYGRYLEWLRENREILFWFHEPQTFWFEGVRRGCVSYLPDYKVINGNGTHEYFEVKGYMDDKSKTKLKRFAKYYPHEKLTVIDKKWFSRMNNKMRVLIPDWE